jgi:hypothetical protein
MSSGGNKGYWRNFTILHNARNLPWLLSNYEQATGMPRGTARDLTPEQIIKVMGLPVPLLTFEFNNIPTLYITSWHDDLTIDGKVFRASADLVKGGKITNTLELHNDGNTFKLSAIRDEMLLILESDNTKNAKVITQAAIIDPNGNVSFVLDVDVGIITTSTFELDPKRGKAEIQLKTDSVYKRLEGVAGTQLASSAQRAWFPEDSSFDQISSKLKAQAQATQGYSGGGSGNGSRKYQMK